MIDILLLSYLEFLSNQNKEYINIELYASHIWKYQKHTNDYIQSFPTLDF